MRIIQTSKPLSFLFITWFLLSIIQCQGGSKKLKTKHNRFADTLLKHLYKNKNECSSTWGVSLLLSLFYPGSTKKTKKQIKKILGYPSKTKRLVWDRTANKLTTAYNGQCQNKKQCDKFDTPPPTLMIANSIWYNDKYQLHDIYQKVVGDFANALDFTDENAGGTINEWVAKSTNGLITSIIDDGPISNALLVAVNSLYLRASWSTPFEKKYTNRDTFYTGPSRDTIAIEEGVHFMHMVKEMTYSDAVLPGYRMISLPYAESDLSMIIILPQDDNAAGTTMTSQELTRALSSLQPSDEYVRVALALPMFRLTSEYDLIPPAIAAGLTRPFSKDAGFCRLLGGSSCWPLTVFKQKVVITVDEAGTEAAAVTFGMTPTSAFPVEDPVEFVVDYPFQFFLRDGKRKVILFEGQVGYPEVPEGVSEATLKARHADGDFWESVFEVSTKPVRQ